MPFPFRSPIATRSSTSCPRTRSSPPGCASWCRWGRGACGGRCSTGRPKAPAFKVRPIAGIPEPRLILTEELLGLCRWIADYYASTLGRGASRRGALARGAPPPRRAPRRGRGRMACDRAPGARRAQPRSTRGARSPGSGAGRARVSSLPLIWGDGEREDRGLPPRRARNDSPGWTGVDPRARDRAFASGARRVSTGRSQARGPLPFDAPPARASGSMARGRGGRARSDRRDALGGSAPVSRSPIHRGRRGAGRRLQAGGIAALPRAGRGAGSGAAPRRDRGALLGHSEPRKLRAGRAGDLSASKPAAPRRRASARDRTSGGPENPPRPRSTGGGGLPGSTPGI